MALPAWPGTGQTCFRGLSMSDQGLQVELSLPWTCARGDLSRQAQATHWQQTLLLLRVLNLMQPNAPREMGAEASAARLEAKLDLALHLLARVLGGDTPAPAPAAITLSAEGCRGSIAEPLQTGEHCLIRLRPDPALALPLDLPAVVVSQAGSLTALRWLDMPEAVREAWEQWLFCQHRRAVQVQRRSG